MRSLCPQILAIILTTFFSLSFCDSSTYAAEIATESATVRANVPSTGGPPGSETVPPTTPILLRPLDGSITSDSTPELVWRQSADPNSNWVAYTVYIDGVARYLGVSNVGNSSDSEYTSQIYETEVRLIPAQPLTEGTHKWRVVAYDNANNVASSTEWTLTIDITPPPITVTDIDTHHNLNLTSLNPSSIPEGTTFEVTGPKDIYFTLNTETYTNIAISFLNSEGQTIGPVIANSNSNTRLILYQHLALGTYSVQITATDHASLVTVLPSFNLLVTQSLISLPIPGVSPPPSIVLPPQLANVSDLFYNYPATIAKITSRPSLAIIYVGSIALILFILLILLKKRYNLILINQHGHPIPLANVRLPINNKVYSLTEKDHGRLFIPNLESSTELSIEIAGLVTSLCLVNHSRVYRITL